MSAPSITLQAVCRSLPDEAELAAATFLARYGGRTLDAYRQDLRWYFQWAADRRLDVLAAARGHIELYRHDMEQRGLAPSTIDRRLSTVCGFYRFAHIDGRIASNPAQYVRRPKVHPTNERGLDRTELARFLFAAERLDHHHAALAVLLGLNGLRVTEACETSIEDIGFERGHRTLSIMGKGAKPATIPLVPRTGRTLDLAIGERTSGPILLRRDGQRLDRRTAHRWVRAIGKRAELGLVHPHMLRAAFIMAALDAGVPLRDVQLAARHADPRTTPSTTDDERTSTATPPTSSSPSSPAPDRLALGGHSGNTRLSPRPNVLNSTVTACIVSRFASSVAPAALRSTRRLETTEGKCARRVRVVARWPDTFRFSSTRPSEFMSG